MSSLSLVAGDTIQITSGTYSGGTFIGLNNVTIIPATGGVTFNGSVYIGNDSSVVFDGTVLSGANYPYGFTFSNFSAGYSAFVPYATAWNMPNVGNTLNCTIKGVQVLNTGGCIISGIGNGITYTGTPASCVYYNLTLDTAMETGTSLVYGGTYAANSTYTNVNIGMTLRNIICINDGTGNSGKVRGNSLYQMVCDNWSIVGPTLNNTGDVGVFSLVGNCTLKNIYRDGGWGWLMRIFNCSLGTPSTTYVYNCIDMNNVSYGTIDTRVDGADINPSATYPIVGNDVMLDNITSGNHQNATGYLTVLCLDYGNSDGQTPPTVYTTSIINCFAFNNPGDSGSSLYHDGDAGEAKTIVKSNNKDIVGALPSGYVTDTYKFYPASGSTLVAGGTTESFASSDIYGISRGSSFDIGAVQHDSTAPTVAITVPTSSGTYSTTASTLDVSGTAADNDFVSSVTWTNSAGGSGTASSSTTWAGSGVPYSSTTWSVTGIALSMGTNTITVTGHDAYGNTGTAVLTVTRNPVPVAPTITGTAPAGTVGTAYSFSYTVTGTPVPTCTVSAGSLPAGLSLSSGGTISGTPTTTGTYSGTVTATNSAGSASQNFSIAITTAVSILTDFGNSAITTPGHWNNVTDNVSTGTKLSNMIDSTGASTGVSMSFTTAFTAPNINGSTSTTGVYPATAMQDSFYTQDATVATVHLAGLSTSRTYTLVFFASRMGSGANRVTAYTVGSTTVTLDATDNSTNTVNISGITPGTGGTIDFTVKNNTGSGYGYLGVLQIQ